MENLIKKIQTYDKCTQGLVDKIHCFVDRVTKEVPAEFRINLCVKDFCKGQFSFWTVSVGGRAIPRYARQCGTQEYLYGDFSNRITYATRAEVVAFAKELPILIHKLEKTLDLLTAEANAV